MKPNPYLDVESLYAEPELQSLRRQMVQWMAGTLTWVDDALKQNPPAWPEPAIRRRALFILDEPLHVRSAPVEPCLNAFLNSRIERAALEIGKEVVRHGMTVWKLYNHGFVVKTPDLTIGFDLHRGPFDSFCIKSELFDRILTATQALFISHKHFDHADADAIPRMITLERPVIVPPGLCDEGVTLPQAIVPERCGERAYQVSLGGTALTYRVFPGHQGSDLLNNVYLVELPGGLKVMHTGDQSNAEDFEVWIDQVHQKHEVDLLLPNCWSPDLPRLIRGISPRLVITGHENEMWHPVDQRQAFSKTYAHIVDETTPVLVLAWGERYHYEPEQSLAASAAVQKTGSSLL